MKVLYFENFISLYHKIKIFSYNIEYSKNKEKCIRKINKLKFNIIEKLYNNTDTIIPPQGSGDILYILLTLRKMKKQVDYIIVNKKYFADLISLFPDITRNVIIVKDLNLHTISNKNYTFDTVYLQGKFKSFLDLFKNAIGHTIEKENIPIYENEKYFINNNFIKNKTVLICPEATTCQNEIPESYWINYAQKLADAGYMPVFNSKHQYGKYINVFYDIKKTIEFANFAGNVVGYRSGLMDVLTYFTNANTIIIYPTNLHPFHEKYIENFKNNPSLEYLEFCSLKTIHPNKNIIEMIFNNSYLLFKENICQK